MENKRYFDILEIEPYAPKDEIQQAYRDLANIWHPDRFLHNTRLKQKAEKKMKIINEAYRTLLSVTDIKQPKNSNNEQPRDTTSQSFSSVNAKKTLYELRSNPIAVSKKSENDIQKLFKLGLWSGTNRAWFPNGYIQNDYQDNNDGTISDHATGLIWQRFGSDRKLNYNEAEAYVTRLNTNWFAGYNDWRLPTVEELFSLMEDNLPPKSIFIDPIFVKDGEWFMGMWWYWSSDKCIEGGRWFITYEHLCISPDNQVKGKFRVRSVR